MREYLNGQQPAFKIRTQNDKDEQDTILAGSNMADNNDSTVYDRKSGVVMIKPAQAAPMGKSHRVSSDSAWPLRGADGKTFAERRKEQEQSK